MLWATTACPRLRGRSPQRVGGGHVAHREHPLVPAGLQSRANRDEPALVEHRSRHPPGVRRGAADRPDHDVRARLRLPRHPRDRATTQTAAVVPARNSGAVAGVQGHAQPEEARAHLPPDARMVVGERPVAGEVEVDAGARSPLGDLGGRAHRRCAAADHRDRSGPRQAPVGVSSSAVMSAGHRRGGWRQKPLVTPVAMTTTS